MKSIHAFIRELKDILESKKGVYDETQIEILLTKYREQVFEEIEKEYQWVGSYNVSRIVRKIKDRAIHELLEQERKQPILTIRLGRIRQPADQQKGKLEQEPIREQTGTKPEEKPSTGKLFTPIQTWTDILPYLVIVAYLGFHLLYLSTGEVFAEEFLLSGILFLPIMIFVIHQFTDIPLLQAIGLFAPYHVGMYIAMFFAQISNIFDEDVFIYGTMGLVGIALMAIDGARDSTQFIYRTMTALILYLLLFMASMLLIDKGTPTIVAITGWAAVAFTLATILLWNGHIEIHRVSPSWAYTMVVGFPFAIAMA